MLQNYEVDIADFIKFTNGGIVVADFVQVREALIKRYKSVYGQDIDLSTGTADGLFVNDLALIMNNILQSFKNLYANLDVDSATGVYLEKLCSLSNVSRKPATRSTASLIITNQNSSPYEAQNLVFVDKSGVEWLYNLPVNFAAYGEEGSTQNLMVTCSEEGKIEAPKGWIDKCIEVNFLNITQPDDAFVGENAESDANLRARRAQSSGAAGTTVLDSLVGALLEVAGIRDVRIYSNNSEAEDVAQDGTTLQPHEVYVILRYSEGVTIDASIIGKIIYEKLTPGIYTIEPQNDPTDGDTIPYNYSPLFDGTALTLFNSNVYWKKAKPKNPTITITLNIFEYFEKEEVNDIANELFEYLNNLPISTDLTTQNVLIETSYADPQFLGKSTYNVSTVEIDGDVNGTYANPDTYYKYSQIGDIDITGNVCTFTIS